MIDYAHADKMDAPSGLPELRYAVAQLVEWVCDYGESITRVLSSLLAVYFVFILLYGRTGSVVHVASPGGVDAPYVTRDPRDLAIFSLGTITMVETHTVGLLPRAEWVLLLKSVVVDAAAISRGRVVPADH